MNDIATSVTDIYDLISEQYAKQYDTSEASTDSKYVDVFLSQLPPRAEILDAGCGDGRDSVYMSNKGFRVTGIDLSANMLTIARSRTRNVRFLAMDIQSITFEKSSFDGLLSSYSLIHVPQNHIEHTVLGYFRLLRPGGVCAIFGQQGDGDHYVDEPFAPGKQIFFNFINPATVKIVLQKVGFTDILIHEEHCDDPYNMSDTNLYIFAKKPIT